MKKILSLLMALTVITTLFAGCSGDGVKETAKGETVSKTESAQPEEELSVGKYEGNTYTNKYFGIKIPLDSSWTFKTQEEIKELNNLTGDILTDEDIKEALESNNIYTDMYATKNEMLDTVNIVIENAKIYGAAMSEEDYVNSSISGVKSGLENAGLTIESITAEKIDFAGEEHSCIKIKGSVETLKLEQTLIVIKKGTYFCNVGFTSYTGTDLSSLIASVTKP